MDRLTVGIDRLASCVLADDPAIVNPRLRDDDRTDAGDDGAGGQAAVADDHAVPVLVDKPFVRFDPTGHLGLDGLGQKLMDALENHICQRHPGNLRLASLANRWYSAFGVLLGPRGPVHVASLQHTGGCIPFRVARSNNCSYASCVQR